MTVVERVEARCRQVLADGPLGWDEDALTLARQILDLIRPDTPCEIPDGQMTML